MLFILPTKSNFMKKIISIIGLIPILAFGQIPVTDVAANGSLVMINNQLLKINIQVKSLDIQLTTMNQNLERLIQLLEKNNTLTSKSKEILKEELEAKKTAPIYVMKSTEVFSTVKLKNEILQAYQASKKSISNLENLDSDEIEKFFTYVKSAIGQTTNLFKQSKTILQTKSIINPEERLKKIDAINTKLKEVLDNLKNYNKKLKQLDSSREIRKTLIGINKK